MTPLDKVLAAFPDAKQETSTRWKVRCPVHDDNKSSLSIGPANNGGVVLHCFAGCTNADIVSHVGLTLADLMPPKSPTQATTPRRIVKTYSYTDEAGNTLFEVVRYEPKDFRQRRPDGKGGHVWNLKDVRMVLYRLPELLHAISAGQAIFLVEGEKDADKLVSLGLAATTNAGGAEKWRPEYTESLRGAHIVLLPDNDAPGRKHTDKIAASVLPVAASVRLLDLPNLPPKGDVSDWLKAGGTADELQQMADAAPEWTPAQAAPEPKAGTEKTLADFEATDGGNADRFALLFGEDVRYIPGLGWRAWNGSRWDAGEEIAQRRARETVRALYSHAGQLAESARYAEDVIERKMIATRAEELLKHAKRSDAAPRIGAIVTLAKADPKLSADVADFEIKPWIVGFPNGTWDKGEFREHRREDHIEHLTAVPFDAGADRTDWETLLHRMTGGDADLAQMLQDVAGYAFSGASSMRLLPWLYGPKGTGKSTFAELLQTALGATAKPLDWSLLSGDREAERLGATIRGMRAVMLPEAGRKRLDADVLKMLSGGDRLPGRLLYQSSSFTVTPTWALIAVSNDPPNMNAYDDALRDRLRALPFEHPLAEGGRFTFTRGEKLESYRRRTDTPLIAGFVAWAVEGLERVYRTQEIHQAKASVEQTRQFWEDADPLTPFWEQIQDGERRLKEGIKAGELRMMYVEWCNQEGIRKPLSTRAWGEACHAHSLTKIRITSGPDKGKEIWQIADGGLFDASNSESERVNELGVFSENSSREKENTEVYQKHGQFVHSFTPSPKLADSEDGTDDEDEPEVF